MSRAKFVPFYKKKIRDLLCDKCLALVESVDMNEADLICEKCAERIKDYFARLICEDCWNNTDDCNECEEMAEVENAL